MPAARTRLRGIVLDGAALDHERAVRGLTRDQLAHAAGISPDVMSRAGRGLPIDRRSVDKIVGALEKIPARALIGKLLPPTGVA